MSKRRQYPEDEIQKGCVMTANRLTPEEQNVLNALVRYFKFRDDNNHKHLMHEARIYVGESEAEPFPRPVNPTLEQLRAEQSQ